MKKVWIQSATLIDSQLKSYPNTDVLVVDGKIAAIGKDLSVPADAEIIEAAGAILAPGFCDLNVNAGEPGFETKEDALSKDSSTKTVEESTVVCQPKIDEFLTGYYVVMGVEYTYDITGSKKQILHLSRKEWPARINNI